MWLPGRHINTTEHGCTCQKICNKCLFLAVKSLWFFDIPDIRKTRYSGVDFIKRISKSANSQKRFGTALANNIATFLIPF